MTRDEGYQFLVLGRSIERADMTSRLVATAAITVGRRLGHLAAGLRCLRGVPAHLQGPGDRARRRRVPAARPALPALGRLRAQRGRALPGAAAVLGHPGRLPERGAAAARPDPRRAGVPLAERLRRRAAQRDGAAAAHLRAGDRRDHPALLRRRRGNRVARSASMSMQLRIVHTTGFEYDGKANTSFNEARLTPLTLPGPDRRALTRRGHADPVGLHLPRLLGCPGDGLRGARPAPVADRHRLGDGAHRPHARRRPDDELGADPQPRRPPTCTPSSSPCPTGCARPHDLVALARGIADRERHPRRGRSRASAPWSTTR